MEENHARAARRWTGKKVTHRRRCQLISIDKLPDDVLLEIFDIYVDEASDEHDEFKGEIEEWQTLVHVCRRWRYLVFGSRRRLNLRLIWTPRTPARGTLDVWPSLPLVIRGGAFLANRVDNLIAALEHSDRVVKINLLCPINLDLEKVLVAMKVPFPELIHLVLRSSNGKVPVLPDSFLGGSAPRLEHLMFFRIPFPGLPKLLLSATHLVKLALLYIPHSGYMPSEAMVTALSTLTSLVDLWLEFESPRSRPDRASRRLPPLTRSVLPALTSFQFKGACEYLDDLVTCIDAPRLNNSELTFFNQIIFDTPQLIQFISRTPTLRAFEKALVRFDYGGSKAILSSPTSGYGSLGVTIPCIELDWQVSSMEQICTSCFPPLFLVEDLYIYEGPFSQLRLQDNIENMLWLELLRPFTAVKNLYLSEKFARRIVPALQELIGGRATEVLPTLRNIFLEGLQPSGTVQEGVQQFVATRQVTSHPIAVSRWDRDRRWTRY